MARPANMLTRGPVTNPLMQAPMPQPPPPPDRDAISAFADATKEKHGLSLLSLMKGQSGHLRLDQIVVPKPSQRQGIGTQALQDIVRFADQHDMPMSLTTAVRDPHHGTTSGARLKQFYKQFGFVENKGRWPEVSDNMIRPRRSERRR